MNLINLLLLLISVTVCRDPEMAILLYGRLHGVILLRLDNIR
eukprot:XP_001709564.1 Hypothetical protein GL50803_38172 [Giardia lamblia ATCC 50803]